MSNTIGAIDRLEIDAAGMVFTGRACGPHDGRRVLLLHGFPQTSWAWRDELWALGAAGYRAVAPDLRGYSCGARPSDVAEYGTEHLLADVLALADAMDMDAFDLVGHDWGGMLAWITAARHPSRLRSLTVVSTPHPLALRQAFSGGDPEHEAHVADTELLRTPELPEQLLLGEDGAGRGLSTLLAESGLDEEDARIYVQALSEPGALTAALNWFRAMDRAATECLEPVRVPTLFVWSTGDTAFGRAAAEQTAEYVTGPFHFEVLKRVSHWIPETAPGELSELLLRHLSST